MVKQYYIFLVSSFVDSSGIQCHLDDNDVLVLQICTTLEVFAEIYTILNIENYNEFIQPLQQLRILSLALQEASPSAELHTYDFAFLSDTFKALPIDPKMSYISIFTNKKYEKEYVEI